MARPATMLILRAGRDAVYDARRDRSAPLQTKDVQTPQIRDRAPPGLNASRLDEIEACADRIVDHLLATFDWETHCVLPNICDAHVADLRASVAAYVRGASVHAPFDRDRPLTQGPVQVSSSPRS